MLDSLRKYVAVPLVPSKAVLSAVSLTAFGLLLAYDLIHPIVAYLLQLYLMF